MSNTEKHQRTTTQVRTHTNFVAAIVGALLIASAARAQFLYINNNTSPNSISAFKVTLTSGALTPVAGSPFATGGDGGFTANVDSIVTACGPFLYATNSSSSSVSGFAVATASGVLTAVPGSPVATGSAPNGVACTPDHSLLFVSNFFDDTISIFDIDPVTGALAANANSPFALPSGSSTPFDLKINAAGTLLFVSQDFSNNVGVYSVAGSGALTPVAGSPFAAGGTEHSGTLTPDNDFYYVADVQSSISAYAVGSGGALAPVAGSPFSISASDLTTNASGTLLFASDDSNDRIHVLGINPTSGVLTPVAGSPFTHDTTDTPGGVLVVGNLLFVANGFFDFAAHTVSVYSIGAGGALTSVSGSPFDRGVTSAATGLAFFASDDTGFTPDGQNASKCEDAVAHNAANLTSCMTKCQIKQADAALKGTPFNEEACETGIGKPVSCRAAYDKATAKLVAKGICPACLDATAQSNVGDLVTNFTEQRNGQIYCFGTTALGGDDLGVVPPDKDTAKCEDAAARNANKLAKCLTKCQIKQADAALKGTPFDEETCENGTGKPTSCRAAYDKASAALVATGTCPACLNAAAQSDVAAVVTSFADQNNGLIFCSGTAPLP